MEKIYKIKPKRRTKKSKAAAKVAEAVLNTLAEQIRKKGFRALISGKGSRYTYQVSLKDDRKQ